VALKFRKVKRPRRRKESNPGAAVTTLLVSGGLVLGSILLIRYMMGKATRTPLQAPKQLPIKGTAATLDMSKPDAGQLEGIGGIFTTGRGLGSL
jgi:hypothetical protein